MGNRHEHRPLSAIVPLALLAFSAFGAEPLRFDIRLDAALTSTPASGRLLVIMSTKPPRGEMLDTGFVPGEAYVAAREVSDWKPGATITFNPDTKAFPQPFSQAPKGNYWFMALLDRNHSYAYNGSGPGDWYSAVLRREAFVPGEGGTLSLELVKQVPDRPVASTDNIKLVEFMSPSLSAFWGRPITMRAGVLLPPSYAKSDRRYASVYQIHGFSGNHRGAWSMGPGFLKSMESGEMGEKVIVFLDGSFPSGHHEFADSANNGPWGQALTTELIPYLEKQYRLIAAPRARLLTGHSSGGWSTFWLQVTYPDFFGGTWSTSPDPTDFRKFTGPDVTPGSHDNVYTAADGTPRNLARLKGENLATWRQFAEQEEVVGEYGGQVASFEWVFSPRGEDGRPMRLFNRQTGEIYPEVAKAWEKFDIRKLLDRNWDTLGPKLAGKLHIFVGLEDNFHLEEPTRLTCDFLKSKGVDVCVFVPGRDHMDLYESNDLYPKGLRVRIDEEMTSALHSQHDTP